MTTDGNDVSVGRYKDKEPMLPIQPARRTNQVLASASPPITAPRRYPRSDMSGTGRNIADSGQFSKDATLGLGTWGRTEGKEGLRLLRSAHDKQGMGIRAPDAPEGYGKARRALARRRPLKLTEDLQVYEEPKEPVKLRAELVHRVKTLGARVAVRNPILRYRVGRFRTRGRWMEPSETWRPCLV